MDGSSAIILSHFGPSRKYLQAKIILIICCLFGSEGKDNRNYKTKSNDDHSLGILNVAIQIQYICLSITYVCMLKHVEAFEKVFAFSCKGWAWSLLLTYTQLQVILKDVTVKTIRNQDFYPSPRFGRGCAL
ncbi:hypothetical protein CHS0354_008431 [Potamilus streckersoni]|uniref:Uncharacterized protein n=1 Tax=Potamilus streckersoni TaxID=2493646 RepID=A0AAE0VH10_9BIVA|nr:hypothetical protein CHS0354_008431 [Potamilus streckersoni]